MARFVANIPFDMFAFWSGNSLAEMFQFGEVTTGNGTTFVLTEDYVGGPDVLALHGSFTEYTGDYPSLGTITSGTFARAGTTYFSFSDASMLVTDGGNLSFTWFVDTDDLRGLFSYMLRGDDDIIGSSGNDVLYGFDGNDTLDGGGGFDRLLGGAGNDTYIADDPSILVYESAGQGTDLVLAAGDYLLPNQEVENLTHTGTNNWTGIGNALANVIRGGIGDDTLDGRGGNDTMYGGDGNDRYVVDQAGDTVMETATGGTDTVRASISYTLGDYVENLALQETSATTGAAAGAINGTGNALDNLIIGNEFNNIIDGGAGADIMAGHGGDDQYEVDNIGDQVLEAADAGTDIVEAFISYTLAANVENLVLGGTDAINAFGNELNNSIVGNAGSNLLNGGVGADLMTGGFGDDTFVVDSNGDQVMEFDGQGDDSVFSSITYTLTDNVETLRLLDSGAINGTGNALANTLVGNSAANILDGRGGGDSMSGGAGDDTYIVNNSGDTAVENAGEGRDRVYSAIGFTLGANVEILALTGSYSVNATGNALNNTIIGNSGINILDGRAGADSMSGGLGNDTYYVDNIGDVVIENADAGRDRVYSSVSYTLRPNIEILALLGNSAINGTGNAIANTLVGNSAANVLDGAGGADSMSGGLGDDTYYVDNAGDRVVESSGAGRDRVYSSISYTLQDNVEILALLGTSAINGTGNALGNTLVGNSAANVLAGGGGADVVTGGLGGDTFVFRDGDFAGPTFSPDRIMDFDHAQGDRINLAGVDANTGATFTGDQAFAFIGTAAFHHTAGELRYEIVNGNTFVSGDTNGDGLADFMIRLDGSHALVSGDFVL